MLRHMQLQHDPADLLKAASAAGHHPLYPALHPSLLQQQQQQHQQLLQQQQQLADRAGSEAENRGDAAAAHLASIPPNLQPFMPNLGSKGFNCPLCNKQGFPRLV